MIKTERLTGIKGWNNSSSDFNNGEHLMNFNINYYFAEFEENDRFFDWNVTMLEADTVIFYLIAICWVEVNASDVIYSAYFHCFICLFSYPFCMLIEQFYWNV